MTRRITMNATWIMNLLPSLKANKIVLIGLGESTPLSHPCLQGITHPTIYACSRLPVGPICAAKGQKYVFV